jgi:REP element-mobilizing transposase RayT
VPRGPRQLYPGATYHVTARGNGGQDIFADDFDRLHLVGLLSRASGTYRWRCLAYCLMTNHYHLVVVTPDPNLSSGMRLIQTRYAHRFNRRHDRHGHVFGDRFHDRRIEVGEHLLSALAYTVLNPVRAGLVDRPGDWPWSSYRATAGLEDAPGFLDVSSVHGLLSHDPDRARILYREFVEAVREASELVERE